MKIAGRSACSLENNHLRADLRRRVHGYWDISAAPRSHTTSETKLAQDTASAEGRGRGQ